RAAVTRADGGGSRRLALVAGKAGHAELRPTEAVQQVNGPLGLPRSFDGVGAHAWAADVGADGRDVSSGRAGDDADGRGAAGRLADEIRRNGEPHLRASLSGHRREASTADLLDDVAGHLGGEHAVAGRGE